jgi:hypothetical protein
MLVNSHQSGLFTYRNGGGLNSTKGRVGLLQKRRKPKKVHAIFLGHAKHQQQLHSDTIAKLFLAIRPDAQNS